MYFQNDIATAIMIYMVKNANQKPKNAFTIIELIVAITIIAVATLGTMVYTSSLATGRDAKRKADLEQIRSALELYRSNGSSSVYPSTIATITDYMKVPLESQNNKPYGYLYATPGNDYTVGAVLENYTGPTCGVVPSICWSLSKSSPVSVPCNYCVGPYGTK